jgi:hypothetical protein
MTSDDKKLAMELFRMLFRPETQSQDEAPALLPPKDASLDFVVGKPYLVWTVTHHFTGEFIGFNGYELVFKDAAWIPDDGRAMEAFANGKFNEVEPCPDGVPVMIGRGSIVLALPASYPLPRSQK